MCGMFAKNGDGGAIQRDDGDSKPKNELDERRQLFRDAVELFEVKAEIARAQLRTGRNSDATAAHG